MSAVAVSAVVVGLTWLAAYRAERKRQKQKRDCDTDVDITVEISSDAKVAVETLCQFGFSKEEATERVNAAVRIDPEGDYATLINMALKHDRDRDGG